MACRSQTILSLLFQSRSTFKPAPVKEKSSIRQVPSAILPILIYRDPLYPRLKEDALAMPVSLAVPRALVVETVDRTDFQIRGYPLPR